MTDKKGINKVGAGLLGVAVGVAAGAATVMFSDKKNRDKAVKKAKELQKQAAGTVEDLQKKAQTLLDKAEDVRDEFLSEKEKVESAAKKQAKKDE